MKSNTTNPTDADSNPGSIEPWMLSAYVLGELEAGDAERVRKAIQADVNLRNEVKQLKQTIAAVQNVIKKTETVASLNKAQSDRVASEITASNPTRAKVLARRHWLYDRRVIGLLAVAASVPIAIVVVPEWFDPRMEMAKNNAPMNLPTHPSSIATENADVEAGAVVPSVSLDTSKEINVDSQPDEMTSVQPSASSSQTIDDVLAEVSEESKDLPEASRMGMGSGGLGGLKSSEISDALTNAPSSTDDLDASVRNDFELSPERSKSSDIATGESGAAIAKGLSAGMSGSGGMGSGGMGSGGMGSGGMGSGGMGSGGMGSGAMGSGGGMKDGSPSPRSFPGNIGMSSLSGKYSEGKQVEGKQSDSKNLSEFESSSSATDGFRVLEEEALPQELSMNVPDFRYKENLRMPRSQSGDRFEQIVETPFSNTAKSPLSTFSIDVDTASYSKIRQYLNQTNTLPNPNMVRIEEMINYFEYNYEGPKDNTPFAANLAMEQCPWNRENKLVRVGLQARKLERNQRPKANLVFLLDVSGSMDEPNKLPLVKRTLSLLTEQLTENDRVAIVVYAGAAGCVLPSTIGSNKQVILDALNHLNAGGSTNGGQGIQLAYHIARNHFIPGGVNRVILCTDGDFNVGVTGDEALVRLLQENAKSNIFLTCLGYGSGNYNDSMMEKVSNQGNGIYGMVDNEVEARRMMVEQLQGTLVTVAKDVKIQVDFNPNQVASYRLIGYEDRRLAARDFDDDQKDAGEIGAGHRVTALYEIVPVGASNNGAIPSDGETSKYAPKPALDAKPIDTTLQVPELSDEILTLKVRYKEPEGSVSTKQEFVLKKSEQDRKTEFDRDLQWASAVAEFGLLLRHSQMAPHADWRNMLERAESATEGDAYRLECIQMMRKAAQLQGR